MESFRRSTRAPAKGAARLGGRKSKAVLAITDQVVSAGTNFATLFIASRALSVPDFGTFVVGFAAATLACCVQRGVVAEPHLVDDVEDKSGRVDAFSLCLLIGLSCSAIMLALASLPIDLFREFWWFAVWTPVFLLQDLARYMNFRLGNVGAALGLDMVWVIAQATAVAILLDFSDANRPSSIIATWGIGATASLVYFVARSGLKFARPEPFRLLRRTREIAGWFSLTSFVSQAQDQMVLLVVGGLGGPAATAVLRSMQLLFMQPVQTCLVGMNSVIVPWAANNRRSHQNVSLWGPMVTLTLAFAVAGSAAVVMSIFAPLLLTILFPAYAEYSHLALPVSLLTVVWAAAMPLSFVLKGLSLGRPLFVVHSTRAIVIVGSAIFGLWRAGLIGAVWSVVAVSLLHLLISQFYCKKFLVPDKSAHLSRLPLDQENE